MIGNQILMIFIIVITKTFHVAGLQGSGRSTRNKVSTSDGLIISEDEDATGAANDNRDDEENLNDDDEEATDNAADDDDDDTDRGFWSLPPSSPGGACSLSIIIGVHSIYYNF